MDNLDDILEKHKIGTLTSYGTRTSHKRKKQNTHVVYNTILSLYNGVAMYAHTQGNKVQRFFWNKKEGGRVVHFGDVPFTVQTGFLTVSLEIAISRAKSLRVSDSACKGPGR